ncbi:lipoyl(octanoyl) transferase LIP2 [Rhodotorula paludigena]|uniref:lipoyl(octanoyl) transferase LIP2 n=1 Tax=Rhodotorula paludigena TaxID=86838 RepID=UPI0031773E1A
MLASAIRRSASSCSPSSTASLARPPIRWTCLPGQIPYERALLLQESIVQARLSAKAALLKLEGHAEPEHLAPLRRVAETDILLLLQHTPVYTAGRREKDPAQLEAEGGRLRALGADYVHTMRGGQTTYHGPGQLVGYSLMDLGAAELSTRCYVDRLERFLEDFATSLHIPVHPLEHTGVFTSPTTKIGSIGIHIRRRISLHGFAFNVEQQTKAWFDNIIACGLADVRSTNVEAELRKRGELGPTDEKRVLDTVPLAVELFGRRYGRKMRQLEPDDEFAEARQMIADGIEGRLPPLERKLLGV